jgi:hypothetical protein
MGILISLRRFLHEHDPSSWPPAPPTRTRSHLRPVLGQTREHLLDNRNQLIDIRPLARLERQAPAHDILNRLTNRLVAGRRHGRLLLAALRALVGKAPVAAEDADAQAAARLVAAGLEGRFAHETRVQRAAQRPDVDFGVDYRVGFYVEELRRPVRHRAVLGGCVLDLERERARGYGGWRGRDGAEVHEDWGCAVVVYHDVAWVVLVWALVWCVT